MLVCWQCSRNDSGASESFSPWVLAFAFVFLASLLVHVYAVFLAFPFLLVEVGSFLGKRRVSLYTIAASLLPLAVVAPLYSRMAAAYRYLSEGQGLPFHPVHDLRSHLLYVYGPGITVALVSMAILTSFRQRDDLEGNTPWRSLSADELVLSYATLALPLIGALNAVLANGPFYDRYFLAGTAGYSLLAAQVCSIVGSIKIKRAIVTAMVFLLSADLLMAASFRWRHLDLNQVEPSSGFPFAADPARPLAGFKKLQETAGMPILVTTATTYLYLHYYAPADLRDRLVFGAPHTNDVFLVGYRRLAEWANVDLHTATYEEFLLTHKDFLVYRSKNGNFNGGCEDCMQEFLSAGYTLRSVERDQDDLLEHFSK